MVKKAGCRTVSWINPDTWKSESEKCKKITIKNKHFLDTTEMSYYDGIVKYPRYHKQAKGICSEIVQMSPDKYFEESAKLHFKAKEMKIYSKEVLHDMAKREQDITHPKWVNIYYQKAKKGSKMPIPVLNFESNEQEGRHRAMVAKKMGLSKIPVLIVERC